ncbi:FG-GAP-like repeat-containing protein [Nonomuraea sp. NPDC005650]|uniref:FG-GAP-like repeat-containing protein n=1 Tax=Nonomuraea sp. NPDC005650 TaxID=3157045 RepID=UPI0033B28152
MIILLASALLLAGCGGDVRPTPSPAAQSPIASPPASPPAPTSGRASKSHGRADDVNGDGRADLLVYAELIGKDVRFLAVVYGSSRGLRAARPAIVSSRTFFAWQIDPGIRADLDGDGFGDILGYGRPGDRDEQLRPYIFWGGPDGIDPRTLPTPVPPPARSDLATFRSVAGDFDGDGAADVAMSADDGQGGANLVVMYGPFSRAGVPTRRTVQPSPTGGDFWRMTVDEIDGRHATGLVVFTGDDGEQTSGWLLNGGPDGLAKSGRELRKGMAATFGDFDGDGARDLAVGDDGSRNDEPGNETEAPEVDKTLTVYYGDGRTWTFKGAAGQAVAGDFDGDGRDDLAFGGARSGYEPVRMFWGGPGGLRAGGGIRGLVRGEPLAAGDYDGDGDDELVLAYRDELFKVTVSDGRSVLNRFDLPPH